MSRWSAEQQGTPILCLQNTLSRVPSATCILHPFLFSHPTWCQRSTGSIFSDRGWQECGCAALLSLALTNYELTHVNKCGKRRRIVVGCCLFFIRFRGRGIKKWLTACRECAYWRRGGGRWERRGGGICKNICWILFILLLVTMIDGI